MKRGLIIISLTIFIFIFSDNSYSQALGGNTYFPLVEDNKYWSELMIEYSFYWDSVYHTYTYKIQGDTTIDQMLFKKVYKQDLYYGFDWYYYTAFREDNDGMVYMWDETEWLLYDFNALEGDTVYVGWYGPCALRVEEVDSVLIDADYRKRMYLSWLGTDMDFVEVWIEGLGSNYGLMWAGLGPTVGVGYRNLCVHDENGLVYMNPNYSSCEMTNVSVNEQLSADLSFYPNPSNDVVIFKGNPEVEFEYNIFDISGKLMKTGILSTGDPVDVSTLRNGIYFISLSTQSEKQVLKMIKQ